MLNSVRIWIISRECVPPQSETALVYECKMKCLAPFPLRELLLYQELCKTWSCFHQNCAEEPTDGAHMQRSLTANLFPSLQASLFVLIVWKMEQKQEKLKEVDGRQGPFAKYDTRLLRVHSNNVCVHLNPLWIISLVFV